MMVIECDPGYGSRTEFDMQKCSTSGLLDGSKENQIQIATINSRNPAVGSTSLLIHLCQQVTRTGLLLFENLVIRTLLGTACINKNIKIMYPKRGVVAPMGSLPVVLETKPDATPQENTVDCPENRVTKEKVPL